MGDANELRLHAGLEDEVHALLFLDAYAISPILPSCNFMKNPHVHLNVNAKPE